VPIVHTFEYAKPKNIPEAVDLLTKNIKTAILAGGTDLVGEIKEGIAAPDLVVDIKGLNELKEISFQDNSLWIGSLATFTDIIESKIINEKFPVIAEMSKMVASCGIRNRATMAGNICSAVPCADSAPILSAYNASVVAVGKSGERRIPADQWFTGSRKTALKQNEFVTGISIASPGKNHSGCFVKLGRYMGEDLAQVNLVVLALDDGTFRVSFGSVAPVPVRAAEIETMINNHKIDDVLIEKCYPLIEKTISPITDIRASKEYRMHMAKVMFERGVKAAVSRLNGGGPEYGYNVI
jgi:carbon-monoxide dehydrogenase medium subunit